MGCYSGGNEPDFGTMYPTQMEDSNGNYILITYQIGAGATWPNSSARIDAIMDARGNFATNTPAFKFTYDLATGTLVRIQGPQSQNFAFQTGTISLAEPFSGGSYGTVNVLQALVANTAAGDPNAPISNWGSHPLGLHRMELPGAHFRNFPLDARNQQQVPGGGCGGGRGGHLSAHPLH
jgi:hypothetical protein